MTSTGNADEKRVHRLTEAQLQQRLEAHQEWMMSKGNKGRIADLSFIDLRGVDLSYSILSHADLHGADLSGSNLEGAHLDNVILSGGNLKKQPCWEQHSRMRISGAPNFWEWNSPEQTWPVLNFRMIAVFFSPWRQLKRFPKTPARHFLYYCLHVSTPG